jgi:hypothetical protein
MASGTQMYYMQSIANPPSRRTSARLKYFLARNTIEIDRLGSYKKKGEQKKKQMIYSMSPCVLQKRVGKSIHGLEE